ncbi:MAG: penicillin-binding protein 2, partial [Actinobacteria bacterium]|nr:penicillin-binding protein 2 [Actinomycetota bacterium]
MGNFSLAHQRLRVLTAISLVVLMLFALRLIDIQAVQAQSYALRASNEMSRTTIAPASRGSITDVNGTEFARSVAAIDVVVDQSLIKDPLQAAKIAAPILGMTVSDVQKQITGKRLWWRVARNVKPATWMSLNNAFTRYNASLDKDHQDKRIFGFFGERVYTREYPSGSLIASLVGFVNQEGVGATGLESSMNSQISGTAGKYMYAYGYGAQIPGSQQELITAKSGTTVRLTIDRDVQWVASQAILQAVKSA